MPSQKQFQHAYSKRFISIMVICVAAVAVLGLAASTRPGEFETYAGFQTTEESLAVATSFLPTSVANVVRRSEGLKHSVQLDDTQTASNEPMQPDEIEDRVEQWLIDEPHEARKIGFFVFTGTLVCFIGAILLLYSEIKAVLVVRELDNFINSGLPKDADLEEREAGWGRGINSTYRPWLSFGGAGTLLLGSLMMTFPLCHAIAAWGMPEASNPIDCWTVMLLGSLLEVVFLATLLLALVWSFTRPWASVLLGSIALGTLVAIMLESPLFILLWAVVAGVLVGYYLSLVPEAQPGYVPDWIEQPLKDSGSGGFTGSSQMV